MDAEHESYVLELEELLKTAKHPKVKKLLEKALDDARVKPPSTEPTVVKPEVKPASKGPPDTAGMVKITNYGWDDSGKFVKLYISSLPGSHELTKDHVKVDFKEKGLNLRVYDLKGKNYCMIFQNFVDHIIPSESTVKVSKGMITVSLKKARSSNKWTCLTDTEKKLKAAREPKTPKYDKDADPNEGIMSLMRNMYQEGDDDMKRMIAKAWTESREKKQKDDLDLP